MTDESRHSRSVCPAELSLMRAGVDVRGTMEGPTKRPRAATNDRGHGTERVISMQEERTGATAREARVIDWFRHPTGLPDDPAIVLSDAWWSAQDVVEQTGLYENRRQCLAELNRLRERGVLLRMGNRFRYRPSSWTGVQFT